MSKHTPGPWKNHGRLRNAGGLPHSAVAADTLLARVYSRSYGDAAEETANANLIAAAPQLLEALEDLVSLAEHAMREANRDGGEYDIAEDLKAARAAIRDARGEA